jgi:hypothetical protein
VAIFRARCSEQDCGDTTIARDQFSTRDSIDLAINTHLISLITPEEIKVAMSALIP